MSTEVPEIEPGEWGWVTYVDSFGSDGGQLGEMTKQIAAAMKKMGRVQRRKLIDALSELFCPHCGREHPKFYKCQCWNEE